MVGAKDRPEMPFLIFLRTNAAWLAAGALLAFLSAFGQTYFIAVFAGEIRAELRLSHSAWGGIYSLATMTSAAIMLWAGALTDRYRVRSLGTAMLVCLALACLAMAALPGVWALFPTLLALRFFGQGMTVQTAMVAMARWFVASRGRALAVASLGFSTAEVVLPLTFVAALGHVGWRWLWVVAAAVILALTPLVWPLLRTERTPQSIARANPSPGMEGRDWTRPEVLRHRLFWMAAPALMACPVFVTMIFFTQVEFAQVKGWSHVAFVALFPVSTVAGIAGMFLAGWAIDRVGTARILPLALLPLLVALLLLSLTQGGVPIALAMALTGLSQASMGTLASAFWAEFYGTRHIGAVKALGGSIMVLGTAIGPGASGLLLDAGISLPAILLGNAGIVALSVLLIAAGIASVAGRLPPRP